MRLDDPLPDFASTITRRVRAARVHLDLLNRTRAVRLAERLAERDGRPMPGHSPEDLAGLAALATFKTEHGLP